jgi:hypothetical protein
MPIDVTRKYELEKTLMAMDCLRTSEDNPGNKQARQQVRPAYLAARFDENTYPVGDSVPKCFPRLERLCKIRESLLD